MLMRISLLVFLAAGLSFAQSNSGSVQAADEPVPRHKTSQSTSAKHDVGSGAADVGKGAAKGAGSVAAGAGHAAGDLVTLHPVGATTDLGKGAVKGGTAAGTGAVKGTGKIIKGTGKALKHIF
jgi:hypothetical protein